jgi:hypothetical protein
MSYFHQWNELLSLIVRAAGLAAIFWWGYKTGKTAGIEKARESRSKQDKELLIEARRALCAAREYLDVYDDKTQTEIDEDLGPVIAKLSSIA